MSHSIERELSIEDLQLIGAHHLGTPLAVYRLKGWYLRFFCWSGWLLLVAGIVILLATIISGLLGWRLFLPSLLGGISGLLAGLVLLGIVWPREQSEHIVVCDHGLLRVKRKIKTDQVEAVRWNDVLAVREGADLIFPDYALSLREGKVLTISGAYQDTNELAEMIRQHSEGSKDG